MAIDRVEDALVEILENAAAVSAIIGNRIFPIIIPQQGSSARVPCLVYSQSDTNRMQRFVETDGTRTEQFNIDAYAVGYRECRGLAAATQAALIDYRATHGSVEIANIEMVNVIDLVDMDPGLFRVQMSFRITHR